MLIIYKDVLCSHAMRLIQYAYRSYSVCSPFIYFFCRQSEHRHEKIYLVKLKIRVLAKEQKQILFTLHDQFVLLSIWITDHMKLNLTLFTSVATIYMISVTFLTATCIDVNVALLSYLNFIVDNLKLISILPARDNLQNKIDVWYVLTPMVTFCM